MKFDVSEYDYPDFFATFPATFCGTTVPWFHFQSLRHMKPQRERSDSVGSGRLGGVSSSIHAHEKEELLPVFDGCWMVHQDSKYAQSV